MDFRIPRVGSRNEKGLRNLFREERSIIKQFPLFKLGKVKHLRDKGEGKEGSEDNLLFPQVVVDD